MGVEVFVDAPVEALGADPSSGAPRIRCGGPKDGGLARSLADAGWTPQEAAVLEADRVISALPAQRLAAALRGGAGEDAPCPQWPPGLAALLDMQPTASVATVSFGFKTPGLLPPRGFGCEPCPCPPYPRQGGVASTRTHRPHYVATTLPPPPRAATWCRRERTEPCWA